MIKDKKRKRRIRNKIDEGGNKVDRGSGHLPRSLLKEGRFDIHLIYYNTIFFEVSHSFPP